MLRKGAVSGAIFLGLTAVVVAFASVRTVEKPREREQAPPAKVRKTWRDWPAWQLGALPRDAAPLPESAPMTLAQLRGPGERCAAPQKRLVVLSASGTVVLDRPIVEALRELGAAGSGREVSIAIANFPGGDAGVEIWPCSGAMIDVAPADAQSIRVTENNKGFVKVYDSRSGKKPLAKNIAGFVLRSP